MEEEADRLAERFKGVNQAAFAREHEVPGGPSMLSQHLKKRRPLNLPAALAYAKGFGVPLEEISPRLAKQARAASVPRPDISAEDLALLDDFSELLPDEQEQWRADLRALADRYRRVRGRMPKGKPTPVQPLTGDLGRRYERASDSARQKVDAILDADTSSQRLTPADDPAEDVTPAPAPRKRRLPTP